MSETPRQRLVYIYKKKLQVKNLTSTFPSPLVRGLCHNSQNVLHVILSEAKNLTKGI